MSVANPCVFELDTATALGFATLIPAYVLPRERHVSARRNDLHKKHIDLHKTPSHGMRASLPWPGPERTEHNPWK